MLELDLAAHPSRIDVTTQRVVQTESLIEELLNDYATLTTCGKDFGDLIDSIRDDWCRNVGLLLQLLSTEGNLADDGHRRALEGRLRSVAEKIRTVKVILGHADGLEVDESAGPADSGGNAREDEGINLKFPQIKELLKQPELLCRLRNVAGVGTEHWNELKGELFREGDRIGSELRVD
ncbi:hypothetical protein M427DRAFT_302265 [Gonapodya prolifera JEL478]|uniref:Uncharacterized protein n=1 Tax=Gonapodya prolifera (strain JEL478) TaxID=1344416 RepID=A0A139AH95_GONPJ|nr:hypothetical protein M427DRAFT_302265 [Gonapodya prolifera JEL478]|eukprot:KXS16176.1 hypothetical protein M427DRAFT_302265 [Gonapodya prolifera JEL478]